MCAVLWWDAEVVCAALWWDAEVVAAAMRSGVMGSTDASFARRMGCVRLHVLAPLLEVQAEVLREASAQVACTV